MNDSDDDLIRLLIPPEPARPGTLELRQSYPRELDYFITRLIGNCDGVEDYRILESGPDRAVVCGHYCLLDDYSVHAFWLDLERVADARERVRYTFHFDPAVTPGRASRLAANIEYLIERADQLAEFEWQQVRSGEAVIREGVLLYPG